MEEGSLLNEALNHGRTTENTLIVDVHWIGPAKTPIDRLLELAATAVQLNEFIQSSQQQQKYPWMQGGDGPVFGIHVTAPNIPHLRCQCQYGPSVADEWKLVGLALEFTKQQHNVIAECFDMDDGQIILIQAADHLPPWVDDIGPENCRHRCWLYQGLVHLIEPQNTKQHEPFLTLTSALNAFENKTNAIKSHNEITMCIKDTVNKVVEADHWHRAAVAIPRPLAQALQQRPDLIGVLCQQFVGQIHDATPKTSKFAMATTEEWIWTTQQFGRTHYSMLRSAVGPPDWKTESSIPSRYQSPQMKRLQREGRNQATPHLRHGLELGVRLVAAVDSIIRGNQTRPNVETHNGRSNAQVRVTELWAQIEQLSTNAEGASLQSSEICQAWEDGPNHARHDLSNVLKCPVFDSEVAGFVTPLSNPNVRLVDQIQQLLKREGAIWGPNQQDEFPLPLRQEVDSEDWMVLPTDEEMEDALNSKSTPKAEGDLGNVLDGFHSFLRGKSTHEGVSHEVTMKPMETRQQPPGEAGLRKAEETPTPPLQLDPKVFLNLLRFTLKAQSGEEITNLLSTMGKSNGDEFFADEDYRVGEEDDDEDDECADDPMVTSMMDAMDNELLEKTSGRVRDGIDETAAVTDENLAEDVHLLTNLVKSMEASGASAGPVTSVMAAMGQDIPKLQGTEEDDN